MNVKTITIVKSPTGADKVYLETDLPESSFPWKGNLSVRFEVSKGSGEKYVGTHFPDVPVKVVGEA